MPDVPPMMRAVPDRDPRAAAVVAAREGCDGGTIFWHAGDALTAAIVLAPETPLRLASQMLPLGAVALRDALGAIGPPELPVHLTWDGKMMLNGAKAGRVGLFASGANPDIVPVWMINYVTVQFLPNDGPGTALWAEGCGDIEPTALLESWSRHLMHRLSEWEAEGPRALHAELSAAAWEREARDPAYLGLSEDLGRLRLDCETTRLDPLTDLVETP